MFKRTYTFTALRSDYSAVMRILEYHINTSKLALIEIHTYPCDGDWLTHFKVRGKREHYAELRDKLQRCWLLEDGEEP